MEINQLINKHYYIPLSLYAYMETGNNGGPNPEIG
jgi:hypothetical protein